MIGKGTIKFIIVIAIIFTLVFIWQKHTIKQMDKASNSTATQSLANPASVYCGKKGGTTVIKTNGSGGQYGLCQFEDNMACEEWAMYRGDCPIGGIKTTGYDNIEQMYCAWSGGKTFAVENATCTLPNGTICSDVSYYNGICPQY